MSIVLDGSNVSTTGVPNSGTAVSASGTTVDFTGIPAGTKRVTVMFYGVAPSGSSGVLVQLGASGSIQTTGYLLAGSMINLTSYNVGGFVSTNGIAVGLTGSTYAIQGQIIFSLLDSATNKWVCSLIISSNNSVGYTCSGSGAKTLTTALDRVRITTLNGTDALSGSVNILYE